MQLEVAEMEKASEEKKKTELIFCIGGIQGRRRKILFCRRRPSGIDRAKGRLSDSPLNS